MLDVSADVMLSLAAKSCFSVGVSRYDLADFEWRVIEPLSPPLRSSLASCAWAASINQCVGCSG